MVDVVEWRIGDPIVIPLNGKIGGGQITDAPSGNRVAHITPMRRPSPVLVDGQFNAPHIRERHEFLSHSRVLDKRLLRKNVLTRFKRGLDKRYTFLWMRRDIDNVNGGIVERFPKIASHRSIGVELCPTTLRACAIDIAKHSDIVPRLSIRGEVVLRNAAAPDEANARRICIGIARLIGKFRRGGALRGVPRTKAVLLF